jgi:uncharacterized protein
MKFFTPISVSKNQHRTPEGFLVCMGSAIARTGSQNYNEIELPNVPPGPDGMIVVERDESQVFAPETIASAEGKDIVINHPDEDVTPDNWKSLSVGHMQHVRRGEGVEDHLLLADLVFKRPDAIQMIVDTPEYELSCGYDAAYEVIGPGRANQCNIRINHCAMVEHGRCGPVCSTKDSLPPNLWSDITPLKHCGTILTSDCNCGSATKDHMSKKSWVDRVRDAFKMKDEAAMEEAMKDADSEESHQHIHVHLGGPETTKPEGGLPETGETRVSSANDGMVGGDTEATFGGKTFFADKALDEAFKGEMKSIKDSVEALGKMVKDGFEEFKKEKEETKDGMAEEAKVAGTTVDESAKEESDKEIEGALKEEAPPGTNDAHKARDSAFLEDSFAKTAQLAEILVPGIAVPTFDRAAAPIPTYGSLCAFRKKALSAYGATVDGAAVLTDIVPNMTLDTMPCREVTMAFRAAATAQKAKNTAMITGTNDESYFKKSAVAVLESRTLADVQRANDAFWAAQRTAE